MTDDKAREMKGRVLDYLRQVLPDFRQKLTEIDARLWVYAQYITDIEHDRANLMELLGFLKFIRMLGCYDYDRELVQTYIRKIEGTWDGSRHVSGGLKFDGRNVRLMPYQVYCMAAIYGFMHDVEMRADDPNIPLQPTEFVRDGMVYDHRRLCIEAHIFQTRKSGKTAFGAALDFLDFAFGPDNGQVLICANSQEQAKIAFKAVKSYALQLDPNGKYLRITAEEINWKDGMPRTNSIKVMSAGGKKKDGLFGSIVHADEHGSATYVKDHSDMQDLVEVCWGSTGPRREPLLIHTTTAGNVTEGPYQIQLRKVQELLLSEERRVKSEESELHLDASEDDWWFALILQPDQWQVTDDLDKLDDEDLFAKVNHSIGVTVQPDYYRRRIKEARTKGEDTLKEVLTKDFNIWRSSRVQQWLSAEQITRLQIDTTIDQLKGEDGWQCFVGMDFSQGDDFNAVSYLCFNNETGTFFADMDAWIAEANLHSHTNQTLYQRLYENGHLHVMPGATIDERIITARMMEIADHLPIIRIGYDAYDAKRFVNDLGLWIYNEGAEPDKYLRPVSQGWAAYNSPTQEMTYMVRNDPPLIHFSNNPLWPWEFQNCILLPDNMDNVKPVKATANGKVDNVQSLLSALILYDEVNGSENNS